MELNETSFFESQLQFIEKEKNIQLEETTQLIQTLKPNILQKR
ncbi:hypothetical protein PCK2_000868 [Pneumocystis canis]|nr:hypothetical protein PCK2_000868 [Pneumocystis canis]